MEFAVPALNDAGVGVLADGRVLQGQGMTPVGSVVANGDGEGCTHTFLGARKRCEVIVDKHMATVFQRDGVGTRLVVGNIQKCHVSPCVTIVTGEGSAYLAVTRAHQDLQPTVFQFQDRGLDAVYGVATVLGGYASGIRSLDVFLVALGTSGFHVLRTHSQFSLNGPYIFPFFLGNVINLHVELPTIILCAGRTKQATIDDFGLILDRSKESFGQGLLVAPSTSAVFRLTEPACPIGHLETHFEKQPQFTVGHLCDNGVPTGLATLVGSSSTFTHGAFDGGGTLSGNACDFGILRA